MMPARFITLNRKNTDSYVVNDNHVMDRAVSLTFSAFCCDDGVKLADFLNIIC